MRFAASPQTQGRRRWPIARGDVGDGELERHRDAHERSGKGGAALCSEGLPGQHRQEQIESPCDEDAGRMSPIVLPSSVIVIAPETPMSPTARALARESPGTVFEE